MNWLSKLSETYDNCSAKIGKKEDIFPLAPLGHTIKEGVHICITIDKKGQYRRARVLDKDEARTIIPVTEKSLGRTNSPEPHPLADQLQYIAKSYKEFGGTKKHSYEQYLEQLKAWVDSDTFSTDEVKAVYEYVSNQSIIKDLVKGKILFVNDNNKLLKKWDGNKKSEKPKIFKVLQANQQQCDCFIRWNVEGDSDELETELQWNKCVWDSWIAYYLSAKKFKGICYANGNKMILAEQHPKKILPGEANAKLLSANDTSGFTYRGRFLDDMQACNVSYEVSQKAHNALTWLIRRQGSSHGSQSVVAWAVKNCDVPKVTDDTLSLIFKDNQQHDDATDFNAGQNIGEAFSKMIAGYSAKLGNTDDVIVMALDSLTSGRAAIKYYRQLTSSEYLERVQHWHINCSWRQRFSKDKKFIGAPAPKDIAKSAYGGKVDNKLLKATVERLLPCIVDMLPLPKDIIECCINNIKRRNSFDFWEWEKNLGITCALYKYKYIERNYTMALEKDRNNRDYLYGRLLALAESVERMALLSSGENRPTNAERLMQRFAEKPYSTWRTIELALNSCKQRLRANLPGFLNNREKDVIEVKDKFVTDDFCDDSKLSGEFLLGYDCQRSELPPWKNKNDDDNNVNINE